MSQHISDLAQILTQAVARFRPDQPHSPANRFVFGFITPDAPPMSIIISRTRAQVAPTIAEAEYLIYSTQAELAILFDPQAAGRTALVDQLVMRPDYPFKNYLVSILLNGLDLEIPDLDYTAKRFESYFPFPPRHPITGNLFRLRPPEAQPLPMYDPDTLPALIADDHPEWVAMYAYAWQLAFKNLRQPEPASGFISNFIDTAFNANTFLWDSCFMLMFGVYGQRHFDFLGTLNNFYAKQHDDGFICREINTYSGQEVFQPLDPRSTGPNILAWTEWSAYTRSHDIERLRAVFPTLMAYHRWWKDWRTHPDGSYWTSGWGSGMDNQTRIPNSELHHRHYSWIDANFQQALNCECLLQMASALHNAEFTAELQHELAHLTAYLNTQMWDECDGFYYDRAPDGSLSRVKTIGAYWGLLSSAIPPERAKRMMAHLRDPQVFNRPHRVPSQAYDSADYNPYGGYWLGGVWSPTNYMVLRGLTAHGAHDLAHEIALNHVENVAAVFAETGTLWENYAPEHQQPGKPAGKNFVGWTGISAITIPLEYLIGLRVNETPSEADLVWDIRLTERHGVLRYPYSADTVIDLICAARTSPHEPPQLTITTTSKQPITLCVRWVGSANQAQNVIVNLPYE